MTIATATRISSRHRDDDFDDALGIMRRAFERAVESEPHLFTIDIGEHPFEALLSALPEPHRQHYRCRSCSDFVKRFGGLVRIDAAGNAVPVLWPALPVDNIFAPAFAAMAARVSGLTVNGVHVTTEPTWGVESNYSNKHRHDWQHFSVRPPKRLVALRSSIATPGQQAAAFRHEFETLVGGLHEYRPEHVRLAVQALQAETFYRSEKCLGVAQWLDALHTSIAGVRGRQRTNLIWRAAAEAPAGWCHVKSSMIGTLLDDIAAGIPMADAARKFASKMDPLRYQRPQAPPSLGNIVVAEKLVEQLGLRASLARRFAKLEDVEAFWVPSVARKLEATGGVFDHLRPQQRATVTDMPAAPPMTWEKFAAKVLPSAETIELAIRSGWSVRMDLCAMVTAVDPSAPPILQWDRPERRNPVSMYLYVGGSQPSAWGLQDCWARVTAMTRDPAHWYGATSPNHANRVFLLLEGCRDLRHTGGGGFFPESLRSELHAVRSTLEAYAARALIAGRDEATACGLVFGAKATPMQLRVTANGTRTTYTIDRMD